MAVKQSEKVGAVMVVGAGIGGIQASLDLAESGFLVYLVDASPTIGGMMPQLDKTFPTNDCAMCILAPKLVHSGRHLNINVMTNSEVDKIEGEAGNFKVTLLQKARYIDPVKCTGCGECARHCPVRAINEFNQGLDRRAATYIKYPQAVPLVYAIDRITCIGCGLCDNVCLARAVKFDDVDKKTEVNVGAVILALGSQTFDPSVYGRLGYNLTNVLTSLEFERILSASGPYKGHLFRPSDREAPKSIAWIQCVGSRNISKYDQAYCSSVCCMYAIKEAIIAKEHSHEPLDCAIFFMDMRTYGKDFEKYYNRAMDEIGVRFIRSRISSIEPVADTGSLRITYATEENEKREEIFDMVVLSVGLVPPRGAKELAERLGIEVDRHNFAATKCFSPVETSRPGIYVCGLFQGPKDIPDTVMEASAAADAAMALLAPARDTLVKEKEYPPEKDVSEEEPRIGVFICH